MISSRSRGSCLTGAVELTAPRVTPAAPRRSYGAASAPRSAVAHLWRYAHERHRPCELAYRFRSSASMARFTRSQLPNSDWQASMFLSLLARYCGARCRSVLVVMPRCLLSSQRVFGHQLQTNDADRLPFCCGQRPHYRRKSCRSPRPLLLGVAHTLASPLCRRLLRLVASAARGHRHVWQPSPPLRSALHSVLAVGSICEPVVAGFAIP